MQTGPEGLATHQASSQASSDALDRSIREWERDLARMEPGPDKQACLKLIEKLRDYAALRQRTKKPRRAPRRLFR